MDRPREEGFHLGETVARWRSRMREMMKEDDAAELIAKSADTTLGVIGGDLGCIEYLWGDPQRSFLFVKMFPNQSGSRLNPSPSVVILERWKSDGFCGWDCSRTPNMGGARAS